MSIEINTRFGGNKLQGTEVADGSITTAKLANEAVTTAKIDDGAVTNAKIASGAVKSDNIDWTTLVDYLLESISSTSTTVTVGTTSGSTYTFTDTCLVSVIIQWSALGNYAWEIQNANGNTKYIGTFLSGNQPGWNMESQPMLVKAGWRWQCAGSNSCNFCRLEIRPLNLS